MRQPWGNGVSKSLATAATTLGQAKNAVLELIFPPACLLCGEPVGPDRDFCRGCDAALRVSEPLMRTGCSHCGFPRTAVKPSKLPLSTASTAANAANDSHDGKASDLDRCGHCRDCEFQFEGVTALWAYQDRVRDAVVAAKYPNNAALSEALGRRLADQVLRRSGEDCPDWVTFTPSHLRRQISRGGNGAQFIAAAVARRLKRPRHSIVRLTRPISKQAWLDDDQRQENVRDAFAVKKSYAFASPRGVAGRHVLLVDDVLTTGATANEIARVVRRAGARRVSLAVVARAVRSA